MSVTEEMYETYANFLGVEIAALKAVVDVEASGSGFEGGFLKIRWEGHKFRKFLSGDQLKEAENKGLAYKYSDRHKYPQPLGMAEIHLLLRCAREINNDAALMSISMGMGQVMGFHYRAIGFSSPQEMFDVNTESIDGQMRSFVGYIDAFGLKDELVNLDWAGFARGYNGPDYKVNNYDVKLEQAYRSHKGTGVVRRGIVIKLGAKGKEVRALQRKLKELGYPINVDGDFGIRTKNVVKLFQADHKLKSDGIVGDKTYDLLKNTIPDPICETEEFETLKKTSRTTKTANAVRKVGAGVSGVGAALGMGSLASDISTVNSIMSGVRSFLTLSGDSTILLMLGVGVVLFLLGNKFMSNDLKEKIFGRKL